MSRCSCRNIKARAPSIEGWRPVPVRLDASPERSDYRRLLLSEHLRWRVTIIDVRPINSKRRLNPTFPLGRDRFIGGL